MQWFRCEMFSYSKSKNKHGYRHLDLTHDLKEISTFIVKVESASEDLIPYKWLHFGVDDWEFLRI